MTASTAPSAPDMPPAHVASIGAVVACLPVAGTRSLTAGSGAEYAVVCWRPAPDSRAYSTHLAKRDTRPDSPTFGAWVSTGNGRYDKSLLSALADMTARAGFVVTSG